MNELEKVNISVKKGSVHFEPLKFLTSQIHQSPLAKLFGSA